MNSMLWTDKYKPKKLNEYLGNLSELSTIKNWLKNWTPKSKSMIIYGSSGTGKTHLAHIVAKRYKYTAVEMNASDQRTDEHTKKFKLLVSTKNIFAKDLLIIDDVEVSHDYGFIKLVGELLKITKVPIILTCSDKYERKIAPIKRKCASIDLCYPRKAVLQKYLNNILEKEKRTLDKDSLDTLMDSCNCDVRFCLSNLEFYSIPCQESNKVDFAQKEKNFNIFSGASMLFNNNISDDEKERIIHSNLFMFEHYIEQNAIQTSRNFDQCQERLDMLSDADIVSHSINTTQTYELLSYNYNLLSQVTRDSIRKKIEFPSYIGKLSKMNDNKKHLPEDSTFKIKNKT